MFLQLARRSIALAAVTLALSSCAVTEDALHASSETLGNTSETSTDATSSTSHRDEDKKKPRDAKEFSEHHLDQLRGEMATGQGAHLASLAELLEVPESQRPAFYRMTKERFDRLFTDKATTALEMLAHLDEQMQQHRHFNIK
jgi:hypothetical protein